MLHLKSLTFHNGYHVINGFVVVFGKLQRVCLFNVRSPNAILTQNKRHAYTVAPMPILRIAHLGNQYLPLFNGHGLALRLVSQLISCYNEGAKTQAILLGLGSARCFTDEHATYGSQAIAVSLHPCATLQRLN